jgi:ammonia channel protein AmtB
VKWACRTPKNALASGIKTVHVFVIGFAGAAAMSFVAFLVGRMKVDDAMGAVSVHMSLGSEALSHWVSRS